MKNYIRANYEDKTWWSLSEASDFTGRSPRTIANWRTRPIGGRQRFRLALGSTEYPIHGPTFKEFIESGGPQGENAPSRSAVETK